MNKKDLIKYVSDKTRITESDAGVIIDVVFGGILEKIIEGEPIRINDFGSFSVLEKKARKAKNPRTQEDIDVPAKKIVKFKASKMMFNMVNGNDNV